MKKNLTIAFIILIIVAIAVYDVWVIAVAGKASSISWILIQAAHDYPMIPLAVGVVLGHLFWRMKTPPGESDK